MSALPAKARHGGYPSHKQFDCGDCWICSLSVNSWGYAHVKIDKRIYRAHRWMWENMNGPMPDGKLALHRCIDAKNCVNPEHIYPGTIDDNTRDRMEQGRHRSAVGEACHWALLKEPQVIEIKKFGTLENLQGFADKFGVSRHAVYQVFAGINWKHLTVDSV